NVGDVRRELHQHGCACDFLHPFGDHAGVLGHLPDGGAHAAFAHAVRAAEVELEAIRAGVFAALDDVVPGFPLGIDHQARDHSVMREALFDFGDLAEVGIDRAIADELDVVEAHHALAVPIDGGVA